VLLRGIIKGPIDPEQAWFWTPEWQSGEREAGTEIAEGSGVVFHSTDEFIAHLESLPPASRTEIADPPRAGALPQRLAGPHFRAACGVPARRRCSSLGSPARSEAVRTRDRLYTQGILRMELGVSGFRTYVPGDRSLMSRDIGHTFWAGLG
jgi:hypothetical protein